MSVYNFPHKQINLSRFKDEIPEDFRDAIVATEVKGSVIVYTSRDLTLEELNSLETVVADHNGTPDKPLRIHSFLDPNFDHKKHDFSIVGLRKVSPKYNRGIKLKAEYRDPESDDIVVEKFFEDVVENGRLSKLKVTFNFYNIDDEVGDSKTEIVKEFNEWETQTIERKRRERQRDFLLAEGERAGQRDAINLLFTYYGQHINAYVDSAAGYWAAAIKTHQPKIENGEVVMNAIETQIFGILEAAPEGQLTIRDAILYQITGELPEGYVPS